mgnify:CR=1 FL=1
MTIHLKAADEATFMQALKDCEWAWETEYRVEVDEDGNETVTEDVIREAGVANYTATHSLDIIGTIYRETGNMVEQTFADGEDTIEVPEMAPIDGWHANLLLHGEDMPEALAEFEIEAPATPIRKFA